MLDALASLPPGEAGCRCRELRKPTLLGLAAARQPFVRTNHQAMMPRALKTAWKAMLV